MNCLLEKRHTVSDSNVVCSPLKITETWNQSEVSITEIKLIKYSSQSKFILYWFKQSNWWNHQDDKATVMELMKYENGSTVVCVLLVSYKIIVQRIAKLFSLLICLVF